MLRNAKLMPALAICLPRPSPSWRGCARRAGVPGIASRLWVDRKRQLEETCEVLDAIERENWADLADELGDLLLQVLFYAEMAAEAGHFSMGDVISGTEPQADPAASACLRRRSLRGGGGMRGLRN